MMELMTVADGLSTAGGDRIPSGKQYEIRHGNQQVTVVEVGGGIRTYVAGERSVLQPYDVEEMCDGAHGTPLVPWPNRIGDGRYCFDGEDLQLSISEPEKSNAIHGLLRWASWRVLMHSAASVVMGVRLHPSPGYPFALEVEVAYRLGPDGLVVHTTATNVGRVTCPYGAGQHPYLSPGEGLINNCMLQFDAQTRIDTDPRRQLPIGTVPVAGSAFDFRKPRTIGDLEVDFAFTVLARDDEGRSWVRLTGADGRTAELWVDRSYPILEIYTADTLAAHRRRRGLGVEPMTCPPNAFQTGQNLIRLEPRTSSTSTWGVRLA